NPPRCSLKSLERCQSWNHGAGHNSAVGRRLPVLEDHDRPGGEGPGRLPAEAAVLRQRGAQVCRSAEHKPQRTASCFQTWRRHRERVLRRLSLPGERHDSALTRNKKALSTELKLWEGYLEQLGPKAHLAGQSFTLADVVVFPTIASLFRFGLTADRYPNLGEYYARVKERPSIRASWPPHWLENLEGVVDLKDF
uniref:GST C-terminal domain-containing protein n=1 Tax=Tetraodon nigroviridis TaxID=99883 RepID=H3CV13_TETNG